MFILGVHRALGLVPEWRNPASEDAKGGQPEGGMLSPRCLEGADLPSGTQGVII